MDGYDDPGDVFAIPDLWGLSSVLTQDINGAGLLFSQLKIDGLSHVKGRQYSTNRPFRLGDPATAASGK